MYCRNCGKEIPDDSHVCLYCGTEVIFNEQEEKRFNGIALASLITSFFVPILGWVFGIMGIKKANNGYGGKAMAILGILIATANFALNVYLMYTGAYDELLGQFM